MQVFYDMTLKNHCWEYQWEIGWVQWQLPYITYCLTWVELQLPHDIFYSSPITDISGINLLTDIFGQQLADRYFRVVVRSQRFRVSWRTHIERAALELAWNSGAWFAENFRVSFQCREEQFSRGTSVQGREYIAERQSSTRERQRSSRKDDEEARGADAVTQRQHWGFCAVERGDATPRGGDTIPMQILEKPSLHNVGDNIVTCGVCSSS